VSVLRKTAALAAALLATVIIAPAASADPVPEPTCAASSTEVTWTSHYDEGRYEMSTLVLTGGLDGCAGGALVVAIGSGQRLYATVPILVTADPLTVDVSEYRIPAEQVERLALTVQTADPNAPAQPAAPTAPGTSVEPDSTGTGADRAITGDRTDSTVGAGTAGRLPTTGADAAWFAALALALVVLGAALRSRTRQESPRG
jgi:LPXTG-motif cell wall-anchored protein